MRADQIVKGRTVAITVAAVAVLGLGGVWAANATGIFERPMPEPTAVVREDPTTPPAATSTTPTPTADPAPVVEAPAPEPDPAPVVDEPDYGQPVPWIADPNNAEGGYWDTTACPSGAAYTAPDGNSYCG